MHGSFEDFVPERQNKYRYITFEFAFRSRLMNKYNSGNFEEVRINVWVNCFVYKICFVKFCFGSCFY